jgi:hypothetical protein
MEKAMYCLGKKAENGGSMPKSAQPIERTGDAPYMANATDHGKTRRIGS